MEEPLRINTDISSASEGQRSQLPELPDDGLCQEDIEDLDEELGSGVSGKVRKCKYLKDGTFFAVKSVSLWESQTAYAIDCEADKQTMKTITAEVNALRQHNCKYLITFYGAYYDAIGGSANFILEYMDVGSLQKVLKEGSSLPKNIVSHITCDALKGLQYIHHTLKMIHRDFKPGNLLLNKRGDVKVTDFGVSRGLESSADSCNSYVGTLIYMAPERVPGGHAKAEYTNKVDIWAVGITVFQMVTGKHPYQQHQAFLDYFQVVELSPSLDQEHDDDLREFVDLALQQEPQNRPDCATLLSTPLMKSIEAISREPEFKTEYIQWLESLNTDRSEHDKLMQDIDDWM